MTPRILLSFTAILLARLQISTAAAFVIWNPPRSRRRRRVSTTFATMTAPPASISTTLGTLVSCSPFATAFFVGGFKGAAGDLVAQSSEGYTGTAISNRDAEKEDIAPKKVDYRRMLAFLLYGGLYQVTEEV